MIFSKWLILEVQQDKNILFYQFFLNDVILPKFLTNYANLKKQSSKCKVKLF